MRSILSTLACLALILALSPTAGMAQEAELQGVMGSIDPSGTSGTLYLISLPGSGFDPRPGQTIAFDDAQMAFKNIKKGDRVRFSFSGTTTPTATNIQFLSAGTVITTDLSVAAPASLAVDIEGDLTVGPGDTVTLSGNTLNGNLKVLGGVVTLEAGATVTGSVEVKNHGIFEMTGASTVKGNIKGGGNDEIIAIELSTVDGDIGLKVGLFLGVVESAVDGNIKVNDTQLYGVLDSMVDGDVEGKVIELIAVIGNTVTGNVKVSNPSDLIATDNTIGHNLSIKAPLSCFESNNIVGGTNMGCP